MSSSRSDGLRGERAGRRAQFLGEFRALADQPSRGALERLIALARDLQLRDDDIAEELTEVRALLGAATIRDAIGRGQLPVVAGLHPLPPGDRCHFIGPARFGRRRSDQYGHLALTSGWLRFHGALDLSVAWGEVASIDRTGHELVVALHDSRRLFRFYCPTAADAAGAAVIARHLASDARAAEGTHPSHGQTQPMHRAT